jgi:hypothetical protein
MKFNLFGSSKPEKKKKSQKSNAASSQIADLEKQLSGWTDNLKQTEQRLKKLSDKASDPQNNVSGTKAKASAIKGLDITPVRPHGPIRELSLDSGDSPGDTIEEGDEGEDLEVVKLAEAKPEAKNPVLTANEGKSKSLNDSFKDLFTSDEEEENPLANLVRTLPEVTINELEDDLKEIKDIIKDWQKK